MIALLPFGDEPFPVRRLVLSPFLDAALLSRMAARLKRFVDRFANHGQEAEQADGDDDSAGNLKHHPSAPTFAAILKRSQD